MTDTTNLNPRWVLCTQALGLDPTPRAPGEDALPGHLSSLVFTLWLRARWVEFRTEQNMGRDHETNNSPTTHEAFNAWLRTGVEAGKWKGNPLEGSAA